MANLTLIPTIYALEQARYRVGELIEQAVEK